MDEYYDVSWGDDDDYPDAEVDALWAGQLSMDRVLETLQEEITAHNKTKQKLFEAERELLERTIEFRTPKENTYTFNSIDDTVPEHGEDCYALIIAQWDEDEYRFIASSGAILRDTIGWCKYDD